MSSVSLQPSQDPKAFTARLDGLRRLRRRLIFGGGGLLTALVLLTAVVSALGSVEDFHARERQSFLEARSAIDYFLFQRDRAYASSINGNDLIWTEQRPLLEAAGAPLAERFRAQGDQLIVRAEGRTAVPWLVLGLPENPLNAAELRAYLGMLEAYSAYSAATISSLETTGPGVMYAYEPQGRLLAISNMHDEAQLLQTLGVATRRQAFALLMREEETARTLPPQAGPISSAFRSGRLASRFGINPLSGQPSLIGILTLADGTTPYFRRVVFESVENIKARLAASERGRFITVSRDGKLIFSSGGMSAAEASALAPWATDTSSKEPLRRYEAGQFIVTGNLLSTDWALLHAYGWGDIWAEQGDKLLVTAAAALSIILLLWALLLRMDRRVFAPALADASRVYESELLSNAIIGTAPIGLALIARDSGAPLLENQAAQRLVAAWGQGNTGGAAVPTLYAELSAHGRAHGSDNAGEFQWPGEGSGRANRMQLQVGMAPASYREQPVWVCAMRDITDQVELEDNLRRAREDSERARESAEAATRAKSAFVATMSHEIRTPLNGVLGHLELLARSPLQASQLERLARIRFSADSLMSIISDVLDFSKIEAGQLDIESAPFPVRPLLEETAILFAPAAQRKGVRLYIAQEFSMDQGVVGDVHRIRQILNNLVGNAVKFTESGRVMLRAGLHIRDEDSFLLCLDVIDSGIGMSPQQLAQVFEPFQQADASVSRRYGGSGLGLALCQQLATALGGSIEAESSQGIGSRFSLRLPVDRLPIPVPAAPLAGQAVTLLSSSPEWRAEYARVLDHWGATVTAMDVPQEAAPGQGSSPLLIVGEQRAWTEAEEALARASHARVIRAEPNGPLHPELRSDGVTVVSAFASEALLAALRPDQSGAALQRSVGAPSEAPSAPRGERRVRVLLVEDNEVNRELLQQQLEELDLDVDAVENGQQALDAFDPVVHAAVLTDINMPVMDGYALATELRNAGHRLPIIAITATALASEREHCLAAGIDELLLKPLNLERLQVAMTALLERHKGQAAQFEPEPPSAAVPPPRRELSSRIKRVFVDSGRNDLANIQQARSAGDSAQLLDRVHGLKGALMMIGERALGDRCGAVEEQLRDGRMPPGDELDVLTADLHACIDTYAGELAQEGP
ncbi:ATP-binding protein [Stenotrophomonas maltophilia]|uniref:hybrid sensor histidine kinase/response regulator n=1 Tax=Stenotrophomonas maltophilia TaxID=40324 RepID=UPI003CEEB62C